LLFNSLLLVERDGKDDGATEQLVLLLLLLLLSLLGL
jgi:hypothetical protein